MKRGRLLTALAAVASACALVACGDDYDPKSALVGVRVLGVKVDTPYAKPAAQPKLSMLLVDGAPERGKRPVNVVWFHGCKNPKGDLYYGCYPELSRRLGEAYQGRFSIIDKEIPGLVTMGKEAVADVPADTLTSRPPTPEGAFPQGRVFVFFAACGGRVAYDPSPPNSSGLPIRCVGAANEDLPAEQFVYGYTPIFVFNELVNANPVLDGFTFGGAPPATTMCSQGCPADHACSGNRCLPVVPRCTAESDKDCPNVRFRPLLAQTIAEIDPISSALDKKETRESIWIEYAALNGRFESGTRVVNDPNRGWTDDYDGKFIAFKAAPGPATLFAVVRDNRGGQAFLQYDVLVR
jgi:hypothetical protein